MYQPVPPPQPMTPEQMHAQMSAQQQQQPLQQPWQGGGPVMQPMTQPGAGLTPQQQQQQLYLQQLELQRRNSMIPQQPMMQQQPMQPTYPQQMQQYQQPHIPQRQPALTPGQQQQMFGQPQHANTPEQPHAPIRTRKRRVSTATVTQPEYVPEPIQPEQPTSLTVDDNQPLTEPGIVAKAVSNNKNKPDYLYQGTSIMTKIQLQNTTSELTEVVAPVPDANIIGDGIYAGMCMKVMEGPVAAHQLVTAEYVFHSANTGTPALADEYVDLDQFITALQSDLLDDSPAAKFIDQRLTSIVNAILTTILCLEATIDSLAEDYVDIINYIKSQPDEATNLRYVKFVKTLGLIVKRISVTRLESELYQETLTIDDRYIVLDTVSLMESGITEIGGSSNTITSDSMPNIYHMFDGILTEKTPVAYLLTDNYKYTIIKVQEFDTIAIKRVVVQQ